MEKIRSAVMLVVACIASPCYTPIIIPIAIALLAGTPVAVWISANLGWVYGGLTLLSIISLILGVRWMSQKSKSRQTTRAGSHSLIGATYEFPHNRRRTYRLRCECSYP